MSFKYSFSDKYNFQTIWQLIMIRKSRKEIPTRVFDNKDVDNTANDKTKTRVEILLVN